MKEMIALLHRIEKNTSCSACNSAPLIPVISIPISKTQNLTGSLVALTAATASYIVIINTSTTPLSITINSGAEIVLLNGQIQDIANITNANNITVKGTGTLSYILYV